MGMKAQATASVPKPKLSGNVIAKASRNVKIKASENPESRDKNNTMGSLTNISKGRIQILPASFNEIRGDLSSLGP